MLTWNMLWPVLLVVAVCAFGLYLRSGPASLAAEVRNLNWTAVALVFVGALLYREGITLRQIAGMIVCTAGLFLISK